MQAKLRGLTLQGSTLLWNFEPEGPAKPTPGRPALSDLELEGRRGRWIVLLGASWGVIGWELIRARTIDDIHRAFQLVVAKHSGHFMAPFLRQTIEPASAKSIRETEKGLREARRRREGIEERQKAQAELLRQAEGAVSEFGGQNISQLKTEIEHRKRNMREIKIRRTRPRSQIRKAEIALKKRDVQNREALQAQLNSCKSELAKIDAEYATEEEILQRVKERLAAITPERKRRAEQILAEAKSALNATEQELSEAKAKEEELEKKLLDQQAYYCRAELLQFIRKKRYALNPRNLANALAGLPEMTCRRSAERCSKLQFRGVQSLIYRVFEFLEQTWRHKTAVSLTPAAAVELFRRGIAKLPKTKLVEDEQGRKRRVENDLRRYLEENWAYLKRAIMDGVQSSKHPRQVPYLITAKFWEYLSQPKTQADILFAQQERLPSS